MISSSTTAPRRALCARRVDDSLSVRPTVPRVLPLLALAIKADTKQRHFSKILLCLGAHIMQV